MKVNKIVLGALAALLVMASCGSKNSNPFGEENSAPQEYKTGVLAEQAVELETVYPVTIKGQEDIELRPRVDGFIDQILVDEGSAVRQGQTLFKINSPQSEQAVSTAQASVNSAQAQVNTAQVNVDRIRPLADKNIVSTTQLKTYENAYEAAVQTLNQAKASLRNAQATLGWTNVTSPVNGVVGSIPYRKGSLVNSQNVLTIVSSTHNVFAYFSINEKDLVSMLNGLEGKTQAEKIGKLPEVTYIMADGTPYSEKGKIKTITGQVNITTGSVNLRADFPNPQGTLRSGFSGKISIPRHIDKAILVPQKATFTQQDKYLAYKVQGDSVVQTLITVVPTPDGKSYVVTDGLKAGDRIVEDGIITLSNGKKIIAK